MERSDAQKLTEMICSRQNGSILEYGFWKDPKWKPIYQKEIIKAVALLKQFSLNDIESALNRNKWIKTLFVKKLPYLCEELKNKRVREEKFIEQQSAEIVVKPTDAVPANLGTKKTQIDILRGLD